MNYILSVFLLLWYCTSICKSDLQVGPDPWHYEGMKVPAKIDEIDLPPDLRNPVRREKQTDTKYGFGEWWFKRLLAIMLKNGQVKKSEDGSIEVSVQMRFDEDKWKSLDECLKSDTALSDAMFRRSVGYVEEAIYKPTITEQIVMAWTDTIQVYLIEYKTYITWLLGSLGAIGIVSWLWKHVSHKHIKIALFVFLYIYEVFISYKEAEQQEYERFMSAVSKCKWYNWISECTISPPDPIIFIKHMNPMKIAIRMFTSLISEPMVSINSTVKIIIQDLTDGLWFPFDKIVYGLLIVIIDISLIYLLIMIVFNFILNIPFKLNFLGIVSIGVKQNRSSLLSTGQERQQRVEDADRINGDRLDKILNVCQLALTRNVHDRPHSNTQLTNNNTPPKLQRSASTGRLPALTSSDINIDKLTKTDNLRKRHVCGDGDH
ncbi:uncharacterized protein LOC142973019 [Anticarsia gemmatalis]|uniref:uncharacterized protein LOC142973019 n=1 Tax=Anticarsia gemmatalis TaxID=129554 RepID=UPI003F75795D